MKLSKKALALILILGVTSGTFVGCSGSNDSPEPSTTPTEQKTDTPKEETKEEPAKEAEATSTSVSGEVVYWSMWNETEPQANILKNAIKNFESANPDAKVSVQWQGRGVKDLVLPAIQSGQKIDIFDQTNMYLSDPSLFLNLDDFLSSPALGSDKSVKDTIIGGLMTWDLSEAAKAGLTGNYSVPYSPYAVTWFYNKDLFDQAGITTLPQTWDEFLATCESLKTAGIAPIISDDAYINMLLGYQLEKYYSSPVVEEMFKDTSHAAWQDQKLLLALKDMETLATNGYIAPSTSTNKYPAGQQQFAMGEAAMYLNASFFPGEVAATAGPDFPWGQFAVPTVNGGDGKLTDVSFGGQSFYVSSKTENPETSLELLRYFVSEATQEEFFTNGFSPCTEGTEWPKEIADQAPYISSATYNVPWGGGASGDFFDGVVTPAGVKVVTGVATAQQAYDEIQAALAKFGK